MLLESILGLFNTFLCLSSILAENRVQESSVQILSSSGSVVIEPESEEALSQLGERNPSENEAKELVEESQESKADPVREVKLSIS